VHMETKSLSQLSHELEQASQLYAEKFNIERDATWFVLKLQEEVGELTQSYLMHSGKARLPSGAGLALLRWHLCSTAQRV